MVQCAERVEVVVWGWSPETARKWRGVLDDICTYVANATPGLDFEEQIDDIVDRFPELFEDGIIELDAGGVAKVVLAAVAER